MNGFVDGKIFRSPYSPGKKRIEKLWANLKNWLRAYTHLYASIQDAVKHSFKQE